MPRSARTIGRGAAVTAALLGGLGIGACATPAERAADAAARLGLQRSVVPGDGFQHVLFERANLGPASTLHVYLEGDGSPERALRSVPPDPTPSQPLAMQLLALDPAPSLLLGRPCYHGAGPCSPWHWSEGRYGEDVVESMATALRRIASERGVQQLVLIGHSGGGTLAMLLAERLPGVRAVVTVAGNLDVAAWTRHHGSAPLQGSLDPATRSPLSRELVQLHLVGGHDDQVPPDVTAPMIARQPSATRRLFPTFDHHCCWASAWPAVLADLDQRLAARTAATDASGG